MKEGGDDTESYIVRRRWWILYKITEREKKKTGKELSRILSASIH